MYTAGPSGVVTVPWLQTRFLVASDHRVLLGDGSVWIFGDLGIIEQQLNQCSNQFPSLCPAVMDAFASDWSIPRTLLDRFLLPTIRPRFQEQRMTGHT